MKSIKIKNLILSLEHNPNIFFILVFMKKNKSKKLGFWKVGKGIISILFDKFFGCFNYVEQDAF